MKRAERRTVDLSEYPDLVVIYLGMRVTRPRGVARVFGLGPKIRDSWQAEPDGLLLHEDMLWSLIPLHLGMRQYWRDFPSLERWARSEPHKLWWQQFLRDTGGTGFWHETYTHNGPIEAVYDDLPKPTGMMRFAPVIPARGHAFGARSRLGLADAQAPPPAITEDELYEVPAGG